MNPFFARVGALLIGLLVALPSAATPAADEILIAAPYVRAVPPMMQNSAMFVTLKNTGTQDRALVKASSRAANFVELHTHINDDGVMRMREVERIDIPAGGSVVLEPGGLHVMLIGLRRPLLPDSTVQIELTFDDGSSKHVVAPIRAVGGMRHAGHASESDASGPAEPLSPVFVNLTSDADWRADMALHWAGMALDRGHATTIWLNVDAVRLAVAHIPHPIHTMHDKSAQDLLRELIGKGAQVLVCGGCLKRAGFGHGHLIEGVQLGHPDKVMPAIFDPATKVISW